MVMRRLLLAAVILSAAAIAAAVAPAEAPRTLPSRQAPVDPPPADATFSVEYDFETPVRARALAASRPVVIEEFTATWCAYCYSVGLALDKVRTNYGDGQVVILAFHNGDGYNISYYSTRASRYGVSGIPAVQVNGVVKRVGGYDVSYGQTGVNASYNTLSSVINSETMRTASQKPFAVYAIGELQPTNPQFDILVETATGFPRPVTVRPFIVEDHIPVTAPNGQRELNFLVRAYLGSQQVTLNQAGRATLRVTSSGSVPHRDASKLSLIVLVDDTSGTEVLGSSLGFDNPYAACGDWITYE